MIGQTISKLFIGLSGFLASILVTDLSSEDVNTIVSILVQIVIGVFTVYKLLKTKKDAKK